MTSSNLAEPTEHRQRVAAVAYVEGLMGWSPRRAEAFLLCSDRLDSTRFDVAKKRCVKGTACGNSCIAPGKTCRIKGNPQKLGRLKQLLALPAAGQTSGQGAGGARAKVATTSAPTAGGRFQTKAELRAAVLNAFGAENEQDLKRDKLFRAVYFKGKKAPDFKSRGTWLELYRENVGVPKSEQNQPDGPRVIRGIDVTKNFRPWHVFNLDPKSASEADIKKAFLQLAKKHHPDVGGDPQTFDALKRMRDSLLALLPAGRRR